MCDSKPPARRQWRPRNTLRLLLAGLLGAGAAVLVACGGSGSGLIPAGNAGPLETDFQAIAQAAQEGAGNCTATESAIHKAESDLQTLPSSVDAGLRSRLQEGTSNLAARARKMCTQPGAQSTTTTETTSTERTAPAKTTPAKTTPATPTTATTETEPSSTSESQSTAPTGTATTPSSTQPPGGGAQAPGIEGQGAEGPQGKGPAGNGPPGHGGEGGGTGVEQ
ncbi:MAG TPA: hypothetical protein VMS02_04655 [Solirubrobacteraceae bacterium]|nr:hypothetical protein [Solirubrobacteraceae bacterium]